MERAGQRDRPGVLRRCAEDGDATAFVAGRSPGGRAHRRPSVCERCHRLDGWISLNRGPGLLIGRPPLASHLRALRNRGRRRGAAGRLPPRSVFFSARLCRGPRTTPAPSLFPESRIGDEFTRADRSLLPRAIEK